MKIELSKGNILIKYKDDKKNGHREAVVVQVNKYETTISIGSTYLIDSEHATNIEYNGTEMAIINVRFIKAIKQN